MISLWLTNTISSVSQPINQSVKFFSTLTDTAIKIRGYDTKGERYINTFFNTGSNTKTVGETRNK